MAKAGMHSCQIENEVAFWNYIVEQIEKSHTCY